MHARGLVRWRRLPIWRTVEGERGRETSETKGHRHALQLLLVDKERLEVAKTWHDNKDSKIEICNFVTNNSHYAG